MSKSQVWVIDSSDIEIHSTNECLLPETLIAMFNKLLAAECYNYTGSFILKIKTTEINEVM